MTPRQLARHLRHLADVLEATDDAEALPPVAMSLTVGVHAGDEGQRVRAVTRLNAALGNGNHRLDGIDDDLYVAEHAPGAPYAFTVLDRVPRVLPVVDLDGAA